jgi:hypothetical protein
MTANKQTKRQARVSGRGVRRNAIPMHHNFDQQNLQAFWRGRAIKAWRKGPSGRAKDLVDVAVLLFLGPRVPAHEHALSGELGHAEEGRLVVQPLVSILLEGGNRLRSQVRVELEHHVPLDT